MKKETISNISLTFALTLGLGGVLAILDWIAGITLDILGRMPQ